MNFKQTLTKLPPEFEGEFFTDLLTLGIYATDASVYRELPQAVAYPKNKSDLQILIAFAESNNTTLIPRAAGTSLAGQCVGSGIVVDISKHFTNILEFNPAEKWVRVQPGVIRDELNLFTKGKGLFFGPETSTANRAMIGGMVGNNSTGTNSIKYGNTRDHIMELEVLLSDGSKATFSPLTKEEFEAKTRLPTLEGVLYQQIEQILSNSNTQENIYSEFPKKGIDRRNTGYAIDSLLDSSMFSDNEKLFNFCDLISGSEGTLAFITEIKLQLVELPPKETVLLCPHFKNVKDALHAVQKVMLLAPYSCELMDKVIMDCTKENPEYNKYRFFLEGDPQALLMIELRDETKEGLSEKIREAEKLLKENTSSYISSKVFHSDISKAWKLRKAGLGLLANIPGDKKAVAVIEDTAVHIDDLSDYIADFTAMMKKHGQEAVYYAHAGAGEIHLRPILNLKKETDVSLFKEIAWDTAKLVKKYKGSLSGEHGDGRVRASFLPFMLGESNYNILKKIKFTWDPNNVFNAGKIIDAKPIDQDLRYEINRIEPKLNTLFDFSEEGGMHILAEKCNGSGDCRKTHLSGGTMCPSYMATKDEKDTTRARANILREFLTQNNDERAKWSSNEIKEVLDLCLSCKGCKSECPSNVDVAVMKSEFTFQYNRLNGTPFRSKLFGNVAKLNALASCFPKASNWINSLSITKKIMGISEKRTPPKLAKQTLKNWFKKKKISPQKYVQTVYFFADEFTNYYDVEVGTKAILLLERLGYKVEIAPISDSGRAYLSKGMLKEAKELANENVRKLIPLISKEHPMIGIEPSAILSFRDEYLRLIDNKEYKDSCIVSNSFTIEEFISNELDKGKITSDVFTSKHEQIILHGHCHQKALSDMSYSAKTLSIPSNYHVELLPTGCCGMAGSFGYEKEHYEISMSIGELVLFPAINKATSEDIICAPGTSCRHQIFDGTNRQSKHPIEVLFEALKE